MTRLLCLALLLASLSLSAAEYSIDSGHSEVAFKVRHLGISKVSGRFDDFSGSVHWDPAHPEASRVDAVINMNSIDTDSEKRDRHLQNEDFFDVEKYPEMTFSSTRVREISDDGFLLDGELSLHGETKPVSLEVELIGQMTDPRGNLRAGFSARAKIDRRDFGISWSRTMDGGGLVVGNLVEVSIEIEAISRKGE